MAHAALLWKEYHQAIGLKNMVQAQAILAQLQSYKNHPVPPPKVGGCGKCNRRFG